MQGAFPPLDIDRIANFPADFGDFSFESLCVRYDFTRNEYQAALNALPGAKELPEPLKTAVHETTHLLHSTTTPFGLFVYRMRVLQTRLVADAIRAARSRGQIVTFPMQRTFRALPPAVAREVEWRMRVWYGIELIVLAMMGESDVYNAHVVNNPFVRGMTISGLFAHMQYYFAQVHAGAAPRHDVSAQRGPNDPPETRNDFEMEEVDGEDARIEATLFSFDLLSGGASTLAVIESAGTVSEYVGNSRLTLEAFKAEISNTRWIHTTVPKSWLHDAIRFVQASTLSEFILSYLALCEVALFAPVLLEHRALRKKGVKSSEILPFVRWHRSLLASSKVGPLTSIRDYDRYTREVCEAAGLTPPQDIVQATVNAGGDPSLDPRERVYGKALRIRMQGPGAFLDSLGILGRLPMDMDFPVIQYTDRILFLKDKVLLHELVMSYLMRAVVRRMLLRADLTVQMPYPPLPEESALYTTELKAMLEQALGMPVPGVVVSQAT